MSHIASIATMKALALALLLAVDDAPLRAQLEPSTAQPCREARLMPEEQSARMALIAVGVALLMGIAIGVGSTCLVTWSTAGSSQRRVGVCFR